MCAVERHRGPDRIEHPMIPKSDFHFYVPSSLPGEGIVLAGNRIHFSLMWPFGSLRDPLGPHAALALLLSVLQDIAVQLCKVELSRIPGGHQVGNEFARARHAEEKSLAEIAALTA